MSAKKIIIIGAGGTSRDILDTINDINERSGKTMFECLGFLDDDPSLHDKKFLGASILGSIDKGKEYPDCFFVLGIGHVKNIFVKEDLMKRLNASLERFATIIHPTADVSKTAKIGIGAVLLRSVVVMSRVVIGNHVVIHPQAVISHDATIGELSFVAPGASVGGSVKIGRSCFIGSNSCSREYISIGDCSIIGMGSVILNDISENSVIVGNPGKFVKKSR